MTVETVTRSSLQTSRWPPPQGEWTFADYARLPDNGMRYEVIQGDLHMNPAPRPRHQRIVLDLSVILHQFVGSRDLGEVYVAPIDVILPDLASPVQPDVLFVAADRLDIIKDEFVEGAPDLIVEVLSPGNPLYDRRTKFQLYARAGVREYWIVDPETRTIDVFVLRGRAYAPLGSFGPGEQARSEVLSDLTVRVSEVCPA
jgi:Uma2 family endonuclease